MVVVDLTPHRGRSVGIHWSTWHCFLYYCCVSTIHKRTLIRPRKAQEGSGRPRSCGPVGRVQVVGGRRFRYIVSRTLGMFGKSKGPNFVCLAPYSKAPFYLVAGAVEEVCQFMEVWADMPGDLVDCYPCPGSVEAVVHWEYSVMGSAFPRCLSADTVPVVGVSTGLYSPGCDIWIFHLGLPISSMVAISGTC